MPAKIDIRGQRFGRLTVIAEEKEKYRCPGGKRVRRMFCRCDCGTEKIIQIGALRQGVTRSCGCLNTQLSRERSTRHGRSADQVYKLWSVMKDRCNNPNNKAYRNYGGRGIKVCDRWLNSFENFLADMGERPQGTTLDRINSNGNYEPDNCRWVTRMEQNNNTRRNVWIWTGEIYVTMAQFAKAFGIPQKRLQFLYRKRGLSLEQILLQEGCLL